MVIAVPSQQEGLGQSSKTLLYTNFNWTSSIQNKLYLCSYFTDKQVCLLLKFPLHQAASFENVLGENI